MKALRVMLRVIVERLYSFPSPFWKELWILYFLSFFDGRRGALLVLILEIGYPQLIGATHPLLFDFKYPRGKSSCTSLKGFCGREAIADLDFIDVSPCYPSYRTKDCPFFLDLFRRPETENMTWEYSRIGSGLLLQIFPGFFLKMDYSLPLLHLQDS